MRSLQDFPGVGQDTFFEEISCFSFILQRMKVSQEEEKRDDSILAAEDLMSICYTGGYALCSPYKNYLEDAIQKSEQQLLASEDGPIPQITQEEDLIESGIN
ncbi:MAG: hypothetical protein WC180_03540 [Candidatus Paceibacterota bacterium]